jgi:hypothetical protein
MIEYALADIDGNELELTEELTFDTISKKSLTSDMDSFSWENRIVERSSLPGAIKLGNSRLENRSVRFSYTRAVGEDEASLRADENLFLQWLNKVVYLLDNTNLLRIKVAPESHDSAYDPGAHKISTEGEFTLRMLDPFWETITASSDITAAPGSGTTNVVLNNTGSLVVPPIITFTATTPEPSIQAFMVATDEGVEIKDDVFGTPGFDTLILDCVEGTLLLGELDRRNKITPGTGFFNLPLGSNTLRFILSVGLDEIKVEWRRRYYI